MKKLFSDGKTFDSFMDSMDSDTSISQLYDDVVNLKNQLAMEQECYEKNACDSSDLLAECGVENEELRKELIKNITTMLDENNTKYVNVCSLILISGIVSFIVAASIHVINYFWSAL